MMTHVSVSVSLHNTFNISVAESFVAIMRHPPVCIGITRRDSLSNFLAGSVRGSDSDTRCWCIALSMDPPSVTRHTTTSPTVT